MAFWVSATVTAASAAVPPWRRVSAPAWTAIGETRAVTRPERLVISLVAVGTPRISAGLEPGPLGLGPPRRRQVGGRGGQRQLQHGGERQGSGQLHRVPPPCAPKRDRSSAD
jgi:hypothetical protein